MDILIKRIFKGSEYTIGKLYIKVNGEYIYVCDTLEDAVRDLGEEGEGKIYGQTAIPAGEYRMIISYSPRFGKDLPLLLDVPHFMYIRIHTGNTKDDTEGCILVGYNKVKGRLVDSRKAFNLLMDKLKMSKDSHHKVRIE